MGKKKLSEFRDGAQKCDSVCQVSFDWNIQKIIKWNEIVTSFSPSVCLFEGGVSITSPAGLQSEDFPFHLDRTTGGHLDTLRAELCG